MYHLRRIKVLLVTCMLASASLWAQDTKISLENATAKATSDQGGDEAASSAIDGDYSKFWHSQWSWGAVFNSHSEVELTIALSEVTLVDYVRYIPRQNNNNGHWGEVEVFYSPSTTGTSFTSVGTFNLNKADIPHDFFLNGTEGVSCGQIKFTIRSGSNNHATAAEIEMYQLDKAKLNAFAQCFSDAVYTELKPGVTSSSIADADVGALVQSMQSDPTLYKKFRVGEYEAYETIWTLQQRLKTKNPYSRYENPTGVYFTAGQSYLVAVSGIEDDAVGLKVKNWYQSESSSTYSLRNGLNYITATTEGNVFVNYYTDNYAEAPKVKIHFINAPVIGYWDQETMTNSDWEALLADKASDDHRIIITQSEHAQTAFPISAWKSYCPTDVETLMGHYQDVQWALRDMMGLEKYGYQTKNRQLFYAITSGLMAAGAEGAYCPYASLGSIMNVDGFDFWGVGHEWGHNNQIDPGFHWSGCGETTNNIYASWAQYHFTANRDAEGNPTVLRLEDENTGIDEYSGMRGGRMQVYFEEALRKGVAWQLQDGPDYHGVTPETKTVTGRDADGNDIGQVTTTSRNYDHFVKLTPFWQLNLWGNLAGKCPDIITDVIHSIRTAENYTATYNTNGKQQINWMKLACDHAGIDLLPFFEKAGMLRPIHAYIEDYGEGWNIINEEMINELKQYVKTKGYPAFTEEINYINAHNMHIYRDGLKLKVTGMQGELSGDKLIVQHSVAQNAVAFETYNAQDELIRITMYGLGSNDEHSFTQVLFPSDAVYVMAVGYDGDRQMVYKVRNTDELEYLIAQTQSLIAEVGEVSGDYDAQKVALTESSYFTNAECKDTRYGDQFTSYSVLCDGNRSTFLHTDYSEYAPAEDHYVRIDLGVDNELAFFNLNYITRYEGNVCAPTKVTIEASNDANAWVTLREVTSGLNTGNNQENTIAELGDGTPYRYIRMKVLGTNTEQQANGHYYFILSEMGLDELVYNVDLNDGFSHISTGAVVAAYKAVLAAQEELNNGDDCTNAYNNLLNKYNALNDAKDAVQYIDFTISSNIVGGGVVYNQQLCTEKLSAPSTLTVDELAAIDLDGYVAKSVTLDGTTITVTYNKVYTVNVVGGADGGVTYNETPYRNGEAFDVPQGFTVNDLSTLDVDGYAAGEISLNGSVVTVTYKKIYTVNVSGVTGQGGVTFGDESFAHNGAIHVLGTLDADQLTAVDVDGYAAYISIEGATVNVIYKMIYRVEVIGTEGGVTFEGTNYLNGTEVHTLSAIELSQLTAVEVEGYLTTVALDNRTIRVTYAKLIQDLSELRNYKAYHIRAKSGEGYFAWNSSITDTYVSLRGVTDWSANNLPSNESVSNKYKEAIDLSDKTVVWQIIKGGDSYYLYQPEKKSYVTRSGRDYMFTADKTALDGIRQNSGADAGTFGIHAGGGYSDGSTYFACIVTNDATTAVRNWYYTDHGAKLQIIENPNVYALDYAVTVVGNAAGGVTFEGEEYSDGETLRATELLTAGDLTVLSFDGYESEVEVNPENKTITVTYTTFNKTELINLIATTEALVTDASSYLGSSLNVTEALIAETNAVLETAIGVRDDSSVSKEEYDETLSELQEAYARLNTAIAYAALPVQLTFDADSPVTYKITINRTGFPVLAYDANEAMVAVTEFKSGNKSHGWYFMAADNGKVYIMPYHDKNTTHALSTNSFSEGNSKVQGMPIGEGGYTQEWTITNANMDKDNRENGWYNITTINPNNINTTWYFSNHGGVSNKMGFYNNANDDGSLFKFDQADFSKSEAYYTLYNYYHTEVKLATGSIEGSTAVGYFAEAVANPYNVAYNNATEVLANSTSTDEDYISAYDALKAANEALVLNMPEEDKYYVLRSVFNGYSKDALVYADPASNKMYWGTGKSVSDATAIWTFTSASDGNFKVTNLHTGSSIGEFIGGNPSPLSEDGGAVSIKVLSGDGRVGIMSNGTMMHAQGNFNAVVNWSTDANGASAWRIVEVSDEELSLVEFALKIGQYRHAGLYLNYAAEIPENVKVYIAHTPDGADGSIFAEELEGTILPARTAVIVKGDADTYNFKYTSADYDGSDDLSVNLLGGSAYLKYQQVEAEGNRCCVFGQKEGVVGLYKNYVQYTDASGSQTDANKVDVAKTDNGTHFKVSANKIYYEYKPSAVAGASAFRFRFSSKEEGTTTIDELLMQDETIIYNLYGQRLTEIVAPGVYIVNGKKMYVSEKMIGNNK